MAQISIPVSNKVGYSMYWNSMWDSKINFSRSLKEDIYLRQFIPLIFNDKVSTKILKTIKYKNFLKVFRSDKYNLHLKIGGLNRNDFYKYVKNLNHINMYSSKVWIFKYQKWVIIYFFIYLPKFNSFKKKILKKREKAKFNNVNNLFSLYKKITLKSKYSYNFFNANFDSLYF